MKPVRKERAIKLESCDWHFLKLPQNKQRKTSPCICFEIRLSDLGSWRLQQCGLHLISKFSMKCKNHTRTQGLEWQIYSSSPERNVQPKRQTWRTDSSALTITKLMNSYIYIPILCNVNLHGVGYQRSIWGSGEHRMWWMTDPLPPLL